MKGELLKLAMKLEHESEFMKQPGPLPLYAATRLGKAFFKLNQQGKERAKKLIEIAFAIVKEGLPFTKFVPIAQLEKQHVVEVGKTYINDHVCGEYIASTSEVYDQELNEIPSCTSGCNNYYLYYS